MVKRPIRLKKLALFVLLTVAVGWIGGLLGGRNEEVYMSLQRPPLSPPMLVFPIVWSILYILIGTGAYLISKEDSPAVPGTLRIYWIQLILNALWPVLFWRFGMYTLSAVLIGVILLMVIALIVRAIPINRASAVLFVPYLLWLLFALYLNIGFAVLN